jgi:peptide/nickel transport system substrate-binding protein
MISAKLRRAAAVGLMASTALLGSSLTALAQAELVLGVIGNSKDVVQPYSPTTSASAESLYSQLYDNLSAYAPDGAVVMELAESMVPNETLDVWTVHLRPNVMRHDGKPFTADDVIASVKYMMDPENNFILRSQIDFVDPEGIRKVDDLTVEFTLNRPFGLFANAFAEDSLMMRALGEDGEVVGTGPFTLDSFTPGQEARLTRFDDYWGDKPDFEKLRIIGFRDQQAVTNALRGGQIDVAYSVPYTDVPALTADPRLKTVVSGNTFYPHLAFRVDTEPFSDPRVNEALKLVVDREQIVNNAFSGYATVANDFLGNNTGCAAPDIPQRTQDIERAKQLLAEAGQSDLSFELVTDGAFAGMMEMAQLYAQQASQAGITVTVRKLDVASFLNRWREWPFLVSLTAGPYEIAATAALLPDQGENATHFDDPEFNELAAQLQVEGDLDKQCELVAKMQQIENERGGNIVPAFPSNITVHRDTVVGLKPDLHGRTPVEFGGVTLNK